MPQVSYLTQVVPSETQALLLIILTHWSFDVPLMSEHSLGLHDFVPVVAPTGKSKIQGTPSDPTVQLASEAYDEHVPLRTHLVPSVVQTPAATVYAEQSASVTATLSPHSLNLQAVPVHLHNPSNPVFPQAVSFPYVAQFPLSKHLVPSETHFEFQFTQSYNVAPAASLQLLKLAHFPVGNHPQVYGVAVELSP